jgi:hypothetical protein
VSFDPNFAADHFRAQVHAGVATNRDLPRPHATADPLDPAAIALDEDDPIFRVSLHREKLSQRRGRITMLNRQGGDFTDGLAGQVVRSDTLGFDWYRRRAFVFQMKHFCTAQAEERGTRKHET